jgi:hypothetical protein
MPFTLLPVAEVQPDELAAGKRALVMDTAWASATGAMSGGVVLLAYALVLGAGPLQIGLLAAIPFIAQAAQLPAVVLVERIRQRKRLGVIAVTVARLLILIMAALPCLAPPEYRLAFLMTANLAVSVLGAMAACAINSWLHQLLPAGDSAPSFPSGCWWPASLAAHAFFPRDSSSTIHPPATR